MAFYHSSRKVTETHSNPQFSPSFLFPIQHQHCYKHFEAIILAFGGKGFTSSTPALATQQDSKKQSKTINQKHRRQILDHQAHVITSTIILMIKLLASLCYALLNYLKS